MPEIQQKNLKTFNGHPNNFHIVIPPPLSASINSQKIFKYFFCVQLFVLLMLNFFYETRFYHNFLRGPFLAVIQKGSKEKKVLPSYLTTTTKEQRKRQMR